MADLNAGIILQGRQPNILAALQQGTQAAAQTNEVRKQNALSQLFQEQGAGIRSGEANALNAYAQFDPAAALGIERTHQGMGFAANADQRAGNADRRADAQLSMSRERLGMARAAGARDAAKYASDLSAAEAQSRLARMTQGLAAMQTAQSPEQWDSLARQFGAPEMAGQFGSKDALIAYYTAGADGLSAALKPSQMSNGDFLAMMGGSESGNNDRADNGLGYAGNVQMGQARLDDYSNATGTGPITLEQNGGPSVDQIDIILLQPNLTEAQRAHLVRLRKSLEPAPTPEKIRTLEAQARAGDLVPGSPQWNTFILNGGVPRKDGFRVRTDRDGNTVIEQGGAVSDNPTQTVADVYNPGDIDAAIALIDEITGTREAPNQSLDRVLGPIAGGGGNDVNDLNVAQRMYYGSESIDTIEKIGQLQNVAWLAARKMLKGGGPITDYESRKAEGAVARLSRVKEGPAFKAAMKDLRDAITDGRAKLEAARGGGAPAQGGKRFRLNPATGELE